MAFRFNKNTLRAFKWIGIALAIKLVMFLYFADCYSSYQGRFITNGIFLDSPDTPTYYRPMENFIAGKTYNSFCRMPGLLPIYWPLRMLFTEGISRIFIILLQLLASIISVYALAETARMVFKSKRIFLLTFFIYAFSSFVSIWDHQGRPDSFATSFLIFSSYYLVLYFQNRKSRSLLIGGIFMAWSIFLRPVHGIILPFLFFAYLFSFKEIGLSIRRSLLYFSPFILAIGLWTANNWVKYERLIILHAPFSECYGMLTEEHLAIRQLIIAWGGDYEPWSEGSEAEWFFRFQGKETATAPVPETYFTSQYNTDSLVVLRTMYSEFENKNTSEIRKEELSNSIKEKSAHYTESFRSERKFRYYVMSKLRIVRQLLIPGRLDDIPLPGLNEMSLFQKILKGGYFILLIAINILGLIGCILSMIRGHKIWVFSLPIFFVIAVIFGFAEQRYLVPIYPYFVIFTAYLIDSLLNRSGIKSDAKDFQLS